MEFRDAGKDYGNLSVAESPAPPKKYYTCLDIDLKQFPELSADIEEECVLVIKGVVTRKTVSENEKCQTIEVRSIGIGADDDAQEAAGGNEADAALSRLKTAPRY